MTVDGTGGGLSVTVDPPHEDTKRAKQATATDGAVSRVDLYLSGLGDEKRPSLHEIVYAIVATYDDGDGLTEEHLKKLWKELSPRTTGGAKRFTTALNRAKDKGLIARKKRGSRAWVCAPGAAVSAPARALVEHIKLDAEKDAVEALE